MTKIGAITVGQSPRTDLMPDMEKIFSDSIQVIQMGGLDGLTKEEIAAFAPQPGDYTLVSRLTDGSSVTFGESFVLPRIQNCIDELEKQGVSLILFLCTGEFPSNFRSNVPLIFPNSILTAVVPATMPNSRLAVLTPSAAQTSQVISKWASSSGSVSVFPVSPYDGLEAVVECAKQIPADEIDLVVMDCIGYTVEMKERVHELVKKPIILPRTLVARMINELV